MSTLDLDKVIDVSNIPSVSATILSAATYEDTKDGYVDTSIVNFKTIPIYNGYYIDWDTSNTVTLPDTTNRATEISTIATWNKNFSTPFYSKVRFNKFIRNLINFNEMWETAVDNSKLFRDIWVWISWGAYVIDWNIIYYTSWTDLVAYDEVANTELDRVFVWAWAWGLSSDWDYFYVSCSAANEVVKVEKATFTVDSNVSVWNPWEQWYYDGYIYVASWSSIVQIETAWLTVVTSVWWFGTTIKNVLVYDWYAYVTNTYNSSPAVLYRLTLSDMTTIISITGGTSSFSWLAIVDWHIYTWWWGNFLLFKARLSDFTMVSSVGTWNIRVSNLCYWDWFLYIMGDSATNDFGRVRVSTFSCLWNDYNIYSHWTYPIVYLNWNVYWWWRIVCWWTIKVNWVTYLWWGSIVINSNTIEIETISQKPIWDLSWVPITYTGIF